MKWASADARRLCEREYGAAPEVEIIGAPQPTAFVPAHLHHILFELLKNSMRAVVEAHGSNVDGTRKDESELPAVQVVITEDDRELAIKVSDVGGGIPKQDMPRIWSYLHTTAKKPVSELIDSRGEIIMTQSMAHGGHGGGHAPMAGLGFGIPLSRVFARYWGGDLEIVSVPNHGTDAHLHLNKLGDSNLFVD